MALNGLPRGDLPSLRLVHPTEKEKVEQWSKNGASWKGALSLDAYQKRERHLLETTLAKDGGITHWVLVDSDARDRRVLSGCETLRKKALIAQNGKVIDVVCHSIGSVFCPPEFRGKGYSQRMMRELGPRLETWQTDNAPSLFSVLFSDIGKVSHILDICCTHASTCIEATGRNINIRAWIQILSGSLTMNLDVP